MVSRQIVPATDMGAMVRVVPNRGSFRTNLRSGSAPVAAVGRPVIKPRRHGGQSLVLTRTARSASALLKTTVEQFLPDQVDGHRLAVYCSPRAYRAIWLSIISFRLVVAACFARAVYSFTWTVLSPREVIATVRHFGVEYDSGPLAGASVMGTITVAVHLHQVYLAVYHSIQERRLVFGKTSSAIGRSMRGDPRSSLRSGRTSDGRVPVPPFTVKATPVAAAYTRVVYDKMQSFRRALVRGIEAFGIRGRFFDVGFYCREVLEVVLQTYQAYQVSYLVSQSWINHLAASVVVLNCWTTPAFHVLVQHNEPLRRVMCLAVDIMLDFFSTVAISGAVYTSYRSQRAQTDWYDPVWIMSAGNTMLFVHVNSWLNLLSRTLPSVSMASCLQAIQPLIKPQSRGHPRPQSQSQSSQTSISSSGRMPLPERVVESRATPSTAVVLAPVSKPKRTVVVHVLFALYGLGVLVVAVLAHRSAHSTPIPGCRMATSHWLTTEYPCAVLELDCQHLELSGKAEDFIRMLAPADKQTLAGLVIMHCPIVHMPAMIQTFSNLVWLEIYNSTIVSWNEEAALTGSKHPKMSSLILVHVNVTEFPRGLLGDAAFRDFPPTLLDIELVDTNLGQLPLGLQHVWPGTIVILLLERCQLASFPSQVIRKGMEVLSLAGNGLTHLPGSPTIELRELSLAYNPLYTFWATTDRDASIKMLHMEGTLIDRLESVRTTKDTVLYAQGTPLCSAISSTNGTNLNRSIVCTPSLNTNGFLFPIDRYTARRSIDS